MQGLFGFEVSIKLSTNQETAKKSNVGALVAVLIVALLLFLGFSVLFMLHAKGRIDLLKHFRKK